MRTLATAGTLLLFMTLTVKLAQGGAWGAGSFENDDALDWVALCVKSTTDSPVTAALDTAVRVAYIQAPDGSAAVAAAEVVAAALGRPNPQLPAALRTWIQSRSRERLVQLAPDARRALTRITDSAVSELQQLWSESNSPQWRTAIADLVSRLGK